MSLIDDCKRLKTIWQGMYSRCYYNSNSSYNNYGARGICMCEEWKNNFEEFFVWAINNGYTKELTIDRINNDKGYFPDNCRWATLKQQANNKRDNYFVNINGVNKTLQQWSESTGLSTKVIKARIERGCSASEVIFNDPTSKRRF